MQNEVIVTTAARGMMPELIKLWELSFGDDEEYINRFFNLYFSEELSLAALLDGRVVGAEHFMPVTIDGRPALYGYALGVLPDLRNLGISRRINHRIIERSQQTGVPYIMHAANESLVPLYLKAGLDEVTFYKEAVYQAATGAPVPDLRELDAGEFTAMRDGFFTKPGYVRWSVPSVAYAMRDNAESGGFCRKLTLSGEDYAVFAIPDGDGLLVRETTIPDELIGTVAPALCAKLGYRSIRLRMPAYSAVAGQVKMNGLGCGLEPSMTAHLGLMLD